MFLVGKIFKIPFIKIPLTPIEKEGASQSELHLLTVLARCFTIKLISSVFFYLRGCDFRSLIAPILSYIS